MPRRGRSRTKSEPVSGAIPSGGMQSKEEPIRPKPSRQSPRSRPKTGGAESVWAPRVIDADGLDRSSAELLRREGVSAPGARTGLLPANRSPREDPNEPEMVSDRTLESPLNRLSPTQIPTSEAGFPDSPPATARGPIRLPSVAGAQALSTLRETLLSSWDPQLASYVRRAEDQRLLFEEALKDYRLLLAEVTRKRLAMVKESESLDLALRGLEERQASLRERERVLRLAEAQFAARLGVGSPTDGVLKGHHGANTPEQARAAGAGVDLPVSSSAGDPSPEHGGPPTTAKVDPLHPGAPNPLTTDVDPTLERTRARAMAARSTRRYGDRAPTGTPRLDDLLMGGLPPRSHVVLVGDAFVGKEVALYAFIAEGLKREEPVIIVTATRGSEEVAKGLRLVLPGLEDHEKKGRVSWVDASGGGASDLPHRFAAKDSDDTAGLLAALVQATKRARTGTEANGPLRVGFLGLSSVLAHHTERQAFGFLQSVLGILRSCDATAMYALEAGALSETQVETLLGRMDGVVLFRQNRDRTFMSVKGFGDVATRDWVECRATDRELVLGSFALERIR